MEYLKNNRIDIPSVGEWVGRFLIAAIPADLACNISGEVTPPEDVGLEAWSVQPQWLRDAMGYDRPVEGCILITADRRLEEIYAASLWSSGIAEYKAFALVLSFQFSKRGVRISMQTTTREKRSPRFGEEVCKVLRAHTLSLSSWEMGPHHDNSPEGAAASLVLPVLSTLRMKSFPKGSDVHSASKTLDAERVTTLLVDE